MIAGIAEPVHGRIAGVTPMALHERLGLQALDDAGLELSDVDAILTLAPRSDSYLIHAAAFAEYLGIAPPTAADTWRAAAPRRRSWSTWRAT